MRRDGSLEARVETYASRLGVGRVATIGDLPVLVELPQRGVEPIEDGRPSSTWATLLERYFGGEAVVFDLAVDRYAEAVGLSEFEQAVLRALSAVRRGAVMSYRELAVAAGHPRAYRAVGSTMARNRLPIILPCHRIVHNGGTLGRYGDDPSWKSRLLLLEGVEVRGGRVV